MNQQTARVPTSIVPRFDYGYIVVFASFLVAMVVVGLYVSTGVFFKPMLNDFGWARATLSAPLAVASSVNGLLSILMGGLADKIGPRKVVILCGVLAGAGYLLMAWASSIWQLYLFLGVLIGTGMSVLVPLVSTVARWFVRRRTFMTGFVVAGGGVGGFIVPLIANWLITSYGWRQSFLYLGMAFLVIVLAAAQFLRRAPSSTAHADKTAGFVAPRLEENIQGLSLKESVGTPYFWLMITSFFCFGISLGTTLNHIVPHATDANLSPAYAAGILSAINGSSIIGNIGLGAIGDKFGNKQLFMITLTLIALSLVGLVYIQELWAFYLFAVVFGLAYGSGLAQQSPLVARVFGIRSHGLILGLLSPGQMFGVALGGFLAGYIFDIKGNYQLIFAISAILCILGIFLMAFTRPAKTNPQGAALRANYH